MCDIFSANINSNEYFCPVGYIPSPLDVKRPRPTTFLQFFSGDITMTVIRTLILSCVAENNSIEDRYLHVYESDSQSLRLGHQLLI